MPIEIIVALIAVGSALLGAVIQAIFSTRFEQSKFVRDQRREAYEKFITALAEISVSKKDSAELDEAVSKLVISRSKIALFGSKEVIKVAANLFENTYSFFSPLDQFRLYQLILAMRRDSVGLKDQKIKVELFAVLFAVAPGGHGDDEGDSGRSSPVVA